MFANYSDNGFVFDIEDSVKANRRELSLIDVEAIDTLPNRAFNFQTNEVFGKEKCIQMLRRFHSEQIQNIERSEFSDKEIIKYLLSTVELLELINSSELNYDRLDIVLQGVKEMLGEFSVGIEEDGLKDSNFESYFIVTDHFAKNMAIDIGKITEKQVFPKTNFEDTWEYFTRILEKTYAENKSIKETLKSFKEKLHDLKKNINSLFEVIELTDMPESPAKL